MKLHETFDETKWYKNHQFPNYEAQMDFWVPAMQGLLKATQDEAMLPLDYAQATEHLLGMGLAGVHKWGRGPHEYQPLSYVALKHVEVQGYKTVGVVGGLLVDPHFRKQGVGGRSLFKLVDAASKAKAQQKFGYEALVANCNDASLPLFLRNGFTISSVDGTSYSVEKPLVQ